MQQLALLQAAGALSASQGRVMWPTKGWGTNRTVTVWQTMQVLSDKLSSRCVTKLSVRIGDKQKRPYLCNNSLYCKLQVRCQQVKDALCHQPKGWSTNRTVTVWQTRQTLSHKLITHCVTSYLSTLVTSKTNSYATSLLQAAVALSASLGRVMWPTKGRPRDKLWDDCGTNRTVTVINYAGTLWQTNVAVWEAICPHWWQAKQTLMQQVSLLQAAFALSASQGRVVWPTNSRLRDKLWDDWGTNRTGTLWQTMQPLSDKLTSRCVTSYPSAFARTKTVSCMTSDSLTSCRCAVCSSRRRSVTNQRTTAWQAMGWLRHKQNSHCVTNYAGTLWQTN